MSYEQIAFAIIAVISAILFLILLYKLIKDIVKDSLINLSILILSRIMDFFPKFSEGKAKNQGSNTIFLDVFDKIIIALKQSKLSFKTPDNLITFDEIEPIIRNAIQELQDIESTKRSGGNKKAAGVAGVSGGTILVSYANNLPDNSTIKPWFVLLGPILSAGISAGWSKIEKYDRERKINDREKKNRDDIIQLKLSIETYLKNPITSKEHKRDLRSRLEELEKLDIKIQQDKIKLMHRVNEVNEESL